MALKIEKYTDGDRTTIRLTGRMQAEHLEELGEQICGTGSAIALDLEEVTLVDVEIVRFLGVCEAQGVSLLNCSPYIRDWIGKERKTGE
jgi:hypothetical protein